MNSIVDYFYPTVYYEVPPERIVDLISELLVELVKQNDNNPTASTSITRFHSRAAPGIGIRDYLLRIIKFTNIENEVLLSTLIFIDRLCGHNPSFAITSLSIHRYLITAIMLGSKVFCDSYCTNTHYAKVGGISVQELNILELEFSFLIKWDFFISPEIIDRYYLGLLRESKIFHTAQKFAALNPNLIVTSDSPSQRQSIQP